MTRLGCGLDLARRGTTLPLVDALGPFRFRAVANRVLLTGDAGAHALVTREEFEALLDGRAPADEAKRAELREKGFLAGERTPEQEAAGMTRRKAFLATGPYLHVLVTTLRCNQGCVYCHASRIGMASPGHDMSVETAERAIEVALCSPSPTLTFEFQGGEPLANWPVVRRVVERALELGRGSGKTIRFSLVSNLSLMDDEKLAFLVDHGVQVCTSLDGPQDLHDANRPLAGGSSHAETVRWMERIDSAYAARGLDRELYHVEALLTVTRASLGRARDIVDEYVRRGLQAIFARPLNPFGFATRTWATIGYGTDDFLAFHRAMLDEMVERNRRGTQILERLATIFLSKILSDTDPNYLDIRSPCGAGIGQIAYDHDGSVFACDEGRMLNQMGDPMFRLGHLSRDGYGDLVESPVVRSLCVASCLEALPGCSDCAYQPYCGSCPVYNYATQGNIFGRMPDNEKCRLHMGVLDDLFGRIAAGDPEVGAIFRRWAVPRDRPFFSHEA
ncbi:MAG TPA: His-Xaa-Ser system radical SAM maturase HxsB [Anaeromyxobacter sp.]